MRHLNFPRYKILDGKLVGTAAKTIVKKVVLDMAIPSPVILSVFYIGEFLKSGLLHGSNCTLWEIKQEAPFYCTTIVYGKVPC